MAALERGADEVEPSLDQLPPVADALLLLPQRLAKCAKVVERRPPLVLDMASGHGTLPKRTVPNLSRQVRPATSVADPGWGRLPSRHARLPQQRRAPAAARVQGGAGRPRRRDPGPAGRPLPRGDHRPG